MPTRNENQLAKYVYRLSTSSMFVYIWEMAMEDWNANHSLMGKVTYKLTNYS